MKDYKIDYIDNNGNTTNWSTLAGSVETAIAYTLRLSDCKEITAVNIIGESTNYSNEEIKLQEESRINEG